MDAAVAQMENCLQGLLAWMQHFKLKMNCDKTEFMVIASQHVRGLIDTSRNNVIAQDSVMPSNGVCNLGVMMTSTMSLDRHISALCRSAYSQIRAINSIKRFMDRRTLETVIYAFVTNKLDYCNSLLLGAPAYQLKRVQRIQNVTARILSGAGAMDHITPVLRDLHWLPVAKRVIYKVLLMLHKLVNGGGAPILNTFRLCENNVFNLRSNHSNYLQMPFTTSTVIYERCFSVASPRLWNELPFILRTEANTSAFKKKLKTFLFIEHFT
jgi:hypothetical protein